MRDPPTVGEERSGLAVGRGRRGDGEEGRAVDVVIGELRGLDDSTILTAEAVV